MVEYSAPVGAPIWFDLTSSSPERAVEFYGPLFGWDVEPPNPEFAGYQNFRLHDRRVAGLHPHFPEAGGPSDLWSVYLHTPDAAASEDAIRAAGGQVMLPSMPVGDLGSMGFAVDPGGADIGFWQPHSHTGFAEWGVHGAPYWFECHSRNQAQALPFYANAFGARPVTVDGAPGNYTQLFFGETSYAGVMDIVGVLPDGAPARWNVYITVDDVAASAAKAVELDGTVIVEPESTPFGDLATVADPMGAQISLGHPPAGM
ncbi:MAG: VOC family protein [Gordonia sp. (in: high G+C Gram-positive bacteria)]